MGAKINIFACKLKDVVDFLIQNHINCSPVCSLIERSKKQDLFDNFSVDSMLNK